MFSDNYYHNNMLQRISKWQFLITFFYYKNKILKNVKKKKNNNNVQKTQV